MDDFESGEAGPVPPKRAGDVLRTAREAHGLTLADIAARTRVPQRHLEAIEASDYSGLPSSTYAVGFAKAYARAVGADEVAIGADVRAEVAQLGKRPPRYEPYVASDPSRVPSRGLAIAGAGIALAILVLIGLWYASDLFRPAPATNQQTVASGAPAIAPPAGPAPAPTLSPTGQVTLAATDTVWLRVYDAADKTLFLGTMKPGDRFDVPADANDPMINVGRPDKLTVTLNGSAVPPLGSGERAIKDVKVGAAALAARGTDVPGASPAPASLPSTETTTAAPRATSGETRSRTTPSRETASRATPPRETSRERASAPRRSSSSPRPRSSPTTDGPENLLPRGFSTSAP